MGGYSGGYGRPFRARSGKSFIGRASDLTSQYLKDRQERIAKEKEWKRTEQELNEKMKQDRIAQEREETARNIQRMEDKRRLRIEETKRAENEAMKQQRHAMFQEERKRQAEIRQAKYDWTDVKGPKINQADLQEARQDSVT